MNNLSVKFNIAGPKMTPLMNSFYFFNKFTRFNEEY